MSVPKKVNRGGRPRKHPVGPRTNLTVRLPTEMREALGIEAEKKGRSLAEEIEWSLADRLEMNDIWGGAPTVRIGRCVAAAIHAAAEGKSWHEDEETRLRCRGAAIGVVNLLLGGPINRLTAAANDQALLRKSERAREDAIEAAVDVVYAEITKLADRTPAVPAPPRQRGVDDLKDIPEE